MASSERTKGEIGMRPRLEIKLDVAATLASIGTVITALAALAEAIGLHL